MIRNAQCVKRKKKACLPPLYTVNVRSLVFLRRFLRVGSAKSFLLLLLLLLLLSPILNESKSRKQE